MPILFDGPVPIDYGQTYVTSRELPDMNGAFAGQANGLCGAGEAGALFLMTGTHSGRVRFTIELHDTEPPAAADEWEEVVEVSFRPGAATIDLVPWGDGSLARLPLSPGHPVYRVRYCAQSMDEGRDPFAGFDRHKIPDGDFTYLNQRPDRYLLSFWPLPAEPAEVLPPAGEMPPTDAAQPSGPMPPTDAARSSGLTPARGARGVRPVDVIVRQTSGAAASWHQWAAALPAPPSLWEQVEVAARAHAERQRQDEERKLKEELGRWGGRLPSDRLRRLGGYTHVFALHDRSLVDGVAEADAGTQRQIAIWAARNAFTLAGIADLDWLAPAWAALERNEPLPAEFTDTAAMLTRIVGEPPAVAATSMLRPRGRGGLGGSLGAVINSPVNPVAMALPALPAAADPDPLRAALEALWTAVMAHGGRHDAFRAEVRRVFPIVDRDSPR